MTRNQNSRFATNPTNIDISRSRFKRNSSLKTSFNAGDIVPIYVDEVLPGDTFKIRTSKVVRMPTLITPVMDNIYLDTYFFFVPNRLVWSHWQQFMGENTESAWIPTVEYEVPQITAPSGGWNVGTVADYMGVPIGVSNLSVSALPFRAYALIVNDWFRDQNLSDPLNIPVDDTTATGSNADDLSAPALGGIPYKAAKFHDYFTSCLPGPLKGPNVTIGLAGEVPVFGNGYTIGLNGVSSGSPTDYGLMAVATPFSDGYVRALAPGTVSNPSLPDIPGDSKHLVGKSLNPVNISANSYSPALGVLTKDQLTAETYPYTGLVADLGLASSISVNQLRLAFQIQKLYEKDARGGTRYIELLKAHFGVTSPDARLQRPEYLGGNRIPININQVIQQSATAEGTTPQGNTAAYSLTTDTHSDFTKSFVEHGFVIGLAVVRYDHTYQQGLRRFWSRKGRFDYYFPVLANIGEQPVLNKEIYAQGSDTDDEVFGYQEAWADYRYMPNSVTGMMRSTYEQSLDSWHLGDDYSSQPFLSDTWIREDKTNIDRVIAVTSAISHQFFGDFYFENETTRPMPVYSIPGLIDHH